MNTLKLTHDPKDARRQAYDDRRQDHGSSDQAKGRLKTYYDQDMKAGLIRSRDRVEMDEALEHLSPRQLEAVATTMLRGAGFDDPEDLSAYTDENGLVSFSAEESPRYMYSSMDRAEFVNTDDDAVHDSYESELQTELQGALRDGQRTRADTDRLYEGISEQDYAEFVDGFSITDRP